MKNARLRLALATVSLLTAVAFGVEDGDPIDQGSPLGAYVASQQDEVDTSATVAATIDELTALAAEHGLHLQHDDLNDAAMHP